MSDHTSNWSSDKANENYHVSRWGAGYFGVNDGGNVTIYPEGNAHVEGDRPVIDLMDVIEDLQEKNINFPCLIRFQDLLRSRVVELNEAFNRRIKDFDYSGKYFGVYPIKVNQNREVVEEILDAGAPYHFGLEAGSKAEILPVLAFNNDPEALTICNGYKDDEYLRLALIGRKLERKVIVVIEKLSELNHVLDLALEMDVEPMLGIRARLFTKSSGKWEDSSGDRAKFGLSTPEIVQACQILKDRGKEDCLKLFHFHVGSQLVDIKSVKNSVREGARIYSKLRKMGFDIEYFDVGGGLGVDYDGSQTDFPSSMNYTLDQYVSDVVYMLQQICKNEEVPEPHIVSESGRALTAYHSCLITNIFSQIKTEKNEFVEKFIEEPSQEKEADQVREMREMMRTLNGENAMEWYQDAQTKKEETLSAFNLGFIGLEDRAKVEALYVELSRRILHLLIETESHPEAVEKIQEDLANQYLMNFSMFQTVPDHWACKHLFPIMPIHRLNEEPSVRATLVDITCDSDGKFQDFIDIEDVKNHIMVHTLKPGQPYFMGIFLLGAYQDIMGDMHNCFGRVNEVHVFMDDEDPEDFYIEEVIRGDTAEKVLSRLQYAPSELVRLVKSSIDKRVRSGKIRPKEGVRLIESFDESIRGYTYLSRLEPSL